MATFYFFAYKISKKCTYIKVYFLLKIQQKGIVILTTTLIIHSPFIKNVSSSTSHKKLRLYIFTSLRLSFFTLFFYEGIEKGNRMNNKSLGQKSFLSARSQNRPLCGQSTKILLLPSKWEILFTIAKELLISLLQFLYEFCRLVHGFFSVLLPI